MSPTGKKIADTFNVFIAVTGLTALAIYSAYELGRADKAAEIKANFHNTKLPAWAASCRLYWDGSRECRPYSQIMPRSKKEWASQQIIQQRMTRVK